MDIKKYLIVWEEPPVLLETNTEHYRKILIAAHNAAIRTALREGAGHIGAGALGNDVLNSGLDGDARASAMIKETLAAAVSAGARVARPTREEIADATWHHAYNYVIHDKLVALCQERNQFVPKACMVDKVDEWIVDYGDGIMFRVSGGTFGAAIYDNRNVVVYRV